MPSLGLTLGTVRHLAYSALLLSPHRFTLAAQAQHVAAPPSSRHRTFWKAYQFLQQR